MIRTWVCTGVLYYGTSIYPLASTKQLNPHPRTCTSMSLWDNVKKVAAKAGNAAMVAGHKTRLSGEILLIDREITSLKQKFGVDLYNHLGPLATSPDFFASDDQLTETLRPPLLAAQREIAALEIRRRKVKEDIKQAEVKRAAAFPDKAITLADKAKNAAKSAALASNEAKLSTDLSVIESQIKHFKQKFGQDIFEVFVNLEDTKGWLPTDRTIRSMYDQARQNVEKAIKRRKDKIAELESLGGSYTEKKETTGYDAPTAPASSSLPAASGNMSSLSSSASPSLPPSVHAPAGQSYGQSYAAPPPTTTTTSYGATAPMSTDPKIQGLFATPHNPPPVVDVFAAAPPAAAAPANSFPTGYSDKAASFMGSSSSFQNHAPTTGFSDSAPMGGGFSDFGSGFQQSPPVNHSSMMGGGFPPQQPQSNHTMGMFQPPPSNDPFASLASSSNNNNKSKSSSGQPDDLLSF